MVICHIETATGSRRCAKTGMKTPALLYTTRKYAFPLSFTLGVVIGIQFALFAILLTNSTNEEVMKRKVRILCWVMTQPATHDSKAKFSRMTWARQCDELIYISEGSALSASKDLPIVKVNASSGRIGLWDKVKEAFKLIHRDYEGKYDWVLKADDDSYVRMDALRRLLSPFDPHKPLHFGEPWSCPYFGYDLPQGFMVGGPGYVLSKEAVQRFVVQLNDTSNSKKDACKRNIKTGEEDIRIGECLDDVGVINVDTRDEAGLATFWQFNFTKTFSHLFGSERFWELQITWYKSTAVAGGICCTNRLVSLHYATPHRMFEYQYLMNEVNPFDMAPTLHRNTKK